MTFSITLPSAAKGASSTRDLIVSVLIKQWPLSTKQIFSALTREEGLQVSYQLVHKTLGQLVEEGIIARNGKNYALSEGWIREVKSFGEQISSRYAKSIGFDSLKDLYNQDAVNLTFVGILELARFLIGTYFNYPNPKNKPSISLWRNTYSIVGLKDEDYNGIKLTFGSGNFYAISEEDNLLDRMFADTLEKYGLHMKLGIKCATPLSDTMVMGDYVGTVFYPPEFRRLWYLQNKRPKKVSDFDLNHHLKMMRDEKAIINMVIVKNEELADQIREQYMKHFPVASK